MGEDLDLVWRTAKSQLYLSEAAHVKKLVGPERIRRNKDALRELRCFQEILGDLHAGHFGRAPERHRAAEEVALRWEQLKSEAQHHGLKAEDLCAPGERLLSYVQCVGSVGSPGSSKFLDDLQSDRICASTRAPSTALDALDEQSFATAEMVSEITSMVDDITWHATGTTTATARKRRQNTELKKLAIELTEQLDQEYTALMASIEEIQALMEAEVAGDARLPSVEDLEDFTKQINVALSTLEATPQASAATAVVPVPLPQPEPSPVGQMATAASHLEAVLEISDVFQESTPPEASPLPVPPVPPAPAVLVPLAERQWRPRWADLASDGSDAEPVAPPVAPPEVARRKEDAAVALCARCQRSLTRGSFSRRAWRQVRGKGAQAGERRSSDNAWCRQCTESSKG